MFKQVIQVFFIIVTCLAGGYWVGTHPQYYQRYLDINKSDVVIYCKDVAELFPDKFQTQIQRQFPMKIKFITENPTEADILLVDQQFLKQNSEIKFDGSRLGESRWQSLFRQISPDFQLDLFKQKKTIPALWKIEAERMRILSFAVNIDKKKKSGLAWAAIQLFMNLDNHSKWLNQHNWGTTLLKFDESALEENRKASAIRKINLNKIQF